LYVIKEISAVFVTTTLIGLAFALGLSAISAWLGDADNPLPVLLLTMFIILPVAMFTTTKIAMIRTLRALPMARGQLAAYLVLPTVTAAVGFAVLLGILVLLRLIPISAAISLPLYLVAVVLLLNAVMLRRGLRMALATGAMLLIAMESLVISSLDGENAILFTGAAVAILLVPVGIRSIHRSLGRSATYRAQR
jgi:hypothetical protein